MAFVVKKWYAPQIQEKINAAAIEAINEITILAAESAQASHWWTGRTGGLQGGTRWERAKVTGKGRVTGKFGSANSLTAFQGLILERRTPFLRPAADKFFPLLATFLSRKVR